MSVADTMADSDANVPARSNQTIALALADILAGLRAYELWTTIGWHDIRQRYRRSVVGPFWITISMAAMIVGLSYLYSGLFDQKFFEYITYVALGIITFTLISTLINKSADVFISSQRIILQTKVAFSVYVYRMIWRNLLFFAHNFIIYCLLVLFGFVSINATALLAVFGLAFIAFNGVLDRARARAPERAVSRRATNHDEPYSTGVLPDAGVLAAGADARAPGIGAAEPLLLYG